MSSTESASSCQSGEQVWSQASEVPGRAYDSQIARSIFDWDRWWVVNVTKRDHGMISQVYSPTTADAIQGRAVVYLDQNHWRTLADCVKDESQIRRKGEIGPARRLIDLQRDGKIILPVSSGNLLETSQLHGDRRYEVGRTMADLAGLCARIFRTRLTPHWSGRPRTGPTSRR